jgi:hypothetical protein
MAKIFSRLMLASACVAVLASSGKAQARPECAVDPEPIEGAELPDYAMRHLDANEMTVLRTQLTKRQWAHVLQTYARQYQPALPVWMVYIDSSGHVSQCVIANLFAGKLLRSQRLIWTMVFSELPMRGDKEHREANATRKPWVVQDSIDRKALYDHWTATRKYLVSAAKTAQDVAAAAGATEAARAAAIKATADAADAANKEEAARLAYVAVLPDAQKASDPDTVDIRFARRTLAQQSDPALIGLIKGLAKGFGFDAASTTAPVLPDSVKPVWMHHVAVDPKDPMTVGFSRMSLIEKAVVELALSPPPGKDFPEGVKNPKENQLDRIYMNIANVKEHTFELGMLAGIVHGRNVATYDATTLQRTRVANTTEFGGYVEAIANLPWRAAWFHFPPCIPKIGLCKPDWQRSSIGAFVGTNVLTGSLGDQLVFGGTIGHLLGDAGLSIGRAIVPVKEPREGSLVTVHRGRLVIGLDLRL